MTHNDTPDLQTKIETAIVAAKYDHLAMAGQRWLSLVQVHAAGYTWSQIRDAISDVETRAQINGLTALASALQNDRIRVDQEAQAETRHEALLETRNPIY